MKNKNSGWMWAVGIVVVIIIIVIAVRSHKKEVGTSDDTGTTGTTSNVMTPTEDVSAGSADAPATSGVTPVTMSYQQALTTYANRRIQFDTACQATPNAATFVAGQNIMLDNRAPQARSIHLGSLGTISIKGYGFKIVNLSLTGLTTNAIAVDCDASQSVAIITVQK